MKLLPKEESYQHQFKIKKNLNFNQLIKSISQKFHAIPDKRRQSHCLYKQHDVMMGALSCMFFQEPSWLQFQKHLDEHSGDNNLHQLFNVGELPSESQVRDILDNVDSEHYRPVFKVLFEQARKDKQLEQYRIPLISGGVFYIAADGGQYHSSKKVHCECCLRKVRGSVTTYQHQVLQGAIMHPDCKQVIPMMPEPILNTDGNQKQDCEHKAMIRFLTKLREDHPRLPILIGGDGLFSDGTIIKHVLSLDMHYLFTCKPGDHKFLIEWLEAFDTWPWLEHTDKKGDVHRYRWRNEVPLSGQSNAPDVNYLEYEHIRADKVIYRNSWITDIEINQSNIWQFVQTGRCRWKIENECFNTLKNQGYEINHNFGHGKKHLSHNMYLSTLLAFFLHQIMELCDDAYQQSRIKFGSKRNLWERLRHILSMFIIPDWYWLLAWSLNTKSGDFKIVDD